MISVCIATYNGAAYIKEQLESILLQIPLNSEVLVGDDGSFDETVEIIEKLQDFRVKIIKNPKNLGYVSNFEKLIEMAAGDYIFLSDQDDIWPPGRVHRMISAMDKSESLLVVGAIDSFVGCVDSRSFFCGFDDRRDSTPCRNIFDMFVGRAVPYYGSAMLLSKDLKSHALPFFSQKISHDIWIAFLANKLNSVSHLTDVVSFRRIHGDNVTNSNRSFFDKIKTRYLWSLGLLNIMFMRG